LRLFFLHSAATHLSPSRRGSRDKKEPAANLQQAY
jgi:hypothetical protein